MKSNNRIKTKNETECLRIVNSLGNLDWSMSRGGVVQNFVQILDVEISPLNHCVYLTQFDRSGYEKIFIDPNISKSTLERINCIHEFSNDPELLKDLEDCKTSVICDLKISESEERCLWLPLQTSDCFWGAIRVHHKDADVLAKATEIYEGLASIISRSLTNFLEYKKLQAHKNRYEVTFKHSFDDVYLIDRNGIVMDINYEMHGLFKKEIIGRPLADFSSNKEEHGVIIDAISKVFANAKKVEYLTKRKIEGKWHYYTNTLSPLIENNKVVLAIGRSDEHSPSDGHKLNADINGMDVHPNTIAYDNEILDHISVGIFRTDTQQNTTYANKALCELCGMSMEKVLGGEWIKTVHPDDLEMTMTKWQEAAQNNKPLYIKESRMVKPGGEIVWISTYADEEKNNQGEIIGYIGTVTDITEQKQIETLKDKTQNEYQLLVESAKAIILKITNKGIIEYANPYAIAFFGYETDEMIGKHVTESIVPGADREGNNLIEMVNFAFANPEEFGDSVNENVCKNGEIKVVSWSNKPLYNEGGEFEYMLSIGHDLTDLKSEQTDNERLRKIIDNSSDFIGIAGMDSRAQLLNNAGRKMVGIDTDELFYTTTMLDYFDDEGKEKMINEIIPHVLKEGRWVGETFFQHFKTKELIPIMFDLFRIDDTITGEPISFGTVTRDIRKDKKVLDQLLKSESTLKRAQEVGKVGSWELDLVNNKLHWSDEIYRLLGLEVNSVEADYGTFLSYVHPEDRDYINQCYTNHIENRVEYNAIHRLITMEGEVKYVQERCESEWDNEGKPIRSIGTATDITELKSIELELERYKSDLEKIVQERTYELEQANEELTQATSELKQAFDLRSASEKKYRVLADNANDLITQYNFDLSTKQFSCDYVSPSVERIFGISVERWIKMGFYERIHADDLKEVKRIYETNISNRVEVLTCACRIKGKAGKYRWMQSSSNISFDGINAVIRSVARDITKQKIIAQKLLQSKNHSRLLFQKNIIGMALKTMKGELIDVNESYAKMLGYELSELLSLNTWDLTPKKYKKQERQQYEEARKNGTYGAYEKEYFHKNGHLVPVKLQGTVIERNGEKMILSSIEDLSERVVAQEKLEETKNQLIISEKMASLGVLTAGIAHEINNPVNFIYAGVNSLEENLKDVNEILEAYENLKPDNVLVKLPEIEAKKNELNFDRLMGFVHKSTGNIKKGAERTSEIVKGLKTFSRIDDDKMLKADLHESLDSTLLLLRNQYKDRIIVDRQYENIPPVLCYPGKLNQVFVNIIANAIHAIEGEGKIIISTTLLEGTDDTSIQITIRDNGMGMNKKIQKRIFEPFFTTKTVGKGTGLGLSISHGIIENHNGKIEVTSSPGKGSEFIITIPVKQTNTNIS